MKRFQKFILVAFMLLLGCNAVYAACGPHRILCLSGKKTTAPLWTPLQLNVDTPGLLSAWWDASNVPKVALSGSNVTSWTDTIQNIVLPAGGTGTPTYSATARNGTPGITFSGGASGPFIGSGSVAATFPQTTDNMTLAVAAYSAVSGGYILDFGYNAGASHFGINDGSSIVSLYNGTNVYTSAESWSVQDRFVLLNSSGGNPAANASWNVDGLASEAFTQSGTIFGTSPAVVIGQFIQGSAAGWNGVVQQVLIIKGLLTTSQRQKLEGWESWHDGKAGSNLPSGHPYKSAPPTT